MRFESGNLSKGCVRTPLFFYVNVLTRDSLFARCKYEDRTVIMMINTKLMGWKKRRVADFVERYGIIDWHISAGKRNYISLSFDLDHLVPNVSDGQNVT